MTFVVTNAFVVLLLSILVRQSVCKIDQTVVRTVSSRYVGDGLTMRQYSDGTDSVTAIFATEDDELLECHVEKGNSVFTQALFSHAVANQDKEEQFLVQMDVAQLGRKCKKTMRDIRRIPEEKLTQAEKRTRSRLDLDALIDGTMFCARQVVDESESGTAKDISKNHSNDSKQDAEAKAVQTSLDRCCQAWQTCTPVVHAMSFTNGLFNPYFWPMRSCDCQTELRTCLSGSAVQDSLAEKKKAVEFASAYFDELQPKCFAVEKEKKCVDRDLWQTRCIADEEVEVFKVL